MAHVPFNYEPLREPQTTIRVMRILLTSTPQTIRLSLEVVAVTSEFKCLSYTWGSDTASREVIINGCSFLVRDNLFDFLVEAHRRKPNGSGPIWIDAVSINQRDVAEKNVQVAMMGDIYKNATRVVAWLGRGDEAMHEAFKFIAENVVIGNYADTNESRRDRAIRKQSKKGSQKQFWDAYDMLGSSPYFSRMWIVQEIILASEYVLWCGHLGLESASVESLYNYISYSTGPGNDQYLAHLKTDQSSFGHIFDRRTKNVRVLSFARSFATFAENGCQNAMDKVFALRSLDPRLADLPVDYTQSPLKLIPQLYERMTAVDARIHLGLSMMRQLGTNPDDLFNATKDMLPELRTSMDLQDVAVVTSVGGNGEAFVDWDCITVPDRDIAVYCEAIESVHLQGTGQSYSLEQGDVLVRPGAQAVIYVFRPQSAKITGEHWEELVEELHERTPEENLAKKEDLKPLNQALESLRFIGICQIASEHRERVRYEALDEAEDTDRTDALVLEPMSVDAEVLAPFADACLQANNVHIYMELNWNRLIAVWRLCWREELFILRTERAAGSWDDEMRKLSLVD